MKLGLAGTLASAFANSKLTPLLVVASLVLGAFAVLRTPREEEPQIVVPMADVLVQFPGATSREVEQRVTVPLERLVSEIPGVEYVYSTSSPGRSLVIVRFLVGQDEERAFVRLRDKLQSHYDLIPPGASQPTVEPRSIDDVPVLALTLHSPSLSPFMLRQVADRVLESIKSVPDVSEAEVIGGPRRELRLSPNAAALASNGLSLDDLTRAVASANQRTIAGTFAGENQESVVTSGQFLRTAQNAEDVVVSRRGPRPILVSDVAEVKDGPEDARDYVTFGSGRGASLSDKVGAPEPAVTLSVAKRKGTNAVDVVNAVLRRVDDLKGNLIPSDVGVSVTRNYGETAAEKSNELLFHMLLAVVSVTVLIALVLGRREALIVLVAIPVTLALTLAVFYLLGYTLNRITLFALIFSIGILVDDAIVVVENIVRHLRTPAADRPEVSRTAILAVDEVGNPTILATLAVIAAILPLAFVGGLMGPYMRPIPVGASAAMLFSLFIAFAVTPWAAIRLLKAGAGTKGPDGGHSREDALTWLYRRIMTPLLRSARARFCFFALVAALLIGACALVGTKAVILKMLPFDNKNEFQVIVDMPQGTSLEQTAAVTAQLADRIAQEPEVKDYQSYVGTAGPYNFNGLVRHYFDRSMSYQADIQVNLLPRSERRAQSHDIVKRLRPSLADLARRLGARIKVAEIPPGPPVLETLVAEVYGPDETTRLDAAQTVKRVFQTTEGVSDIDWYVDDDQRTVGFTVDKQKAALMGIDADGIDRTLKAALGGEQVGLMHDESSREDVPITVRLPRADRSSLVSLAGLTYKGVPLSELVRYEPEQTDKAIYHKNLLPVIYVTGDVVGRQESPVYAIMRMNSALNRLRLHDGSRLNVLSIRVPDTASAGMKWDGEWQITYEVFRDLGIAFAAVIVLIYILVVSWFQSFKTPLVIMAPIPLTLVGILPGHWLLGAFVTATSIIGFIAGAGIIVRNSIILVDFIELRRRQGLPLEEAVIDAGATRFRPMLLTAAAVIAGSSVILFDPIFQGLAISLMAGEIASTLLSRFAVPVLYYLSERRNPAPSVPALAAATMP